MDIGVLQAGFEILACVEMDPHCCETLRSVATRDRRKTRVVEEDIRKVDPGALMAELGLFPGELDLLCGGPPCQSFSQIGKRGSLEDERGMLLFQMVRFAEVCKPKAVLLEQVKGVLTAPDSAGRAGGVFDLLLRHLEALGYVPKWRTLLAADYGVAQLRQRVFIVATLKPNGFEFPIATHVHPSRVTPLFPLPPYVSAGAALKGLGKPARANGFLPEDGHVDITPEGDRRRIHGVQEGSHLARELHLPKEQRGGLTKKDTTKFLRVSRASPSNTLRCGEIFFHPTEDRYLTPREYMRLHGYPDDYFLKGPVRGRSGRVRNLDQHRQVANSVPPPVARSIAANIIRVLECRKFSKSSVIRSRTNHQGRTAGD